MRTGHLISHLISVGTLLVLLLLPQTSALIKDCGPDYNYGKNDNYAVRAMTDDLYCPYPFLPAAIWIYGAEGLVLDCHGRSVSGNSIPALRIEESANITLVNCNLSADEGIVPILYVNAHPALIVDDPRAEASSYLRPPPAPPNRTAAEMALIAQAAANKTAPPVQPAVSQASNASGNPAPASPGASSSSSLFPIIILLIIIAAVVFLFVRRKRPKRGKKGIILLLAFAALVAMNAHNAEAACSGACAGNVCDFTSSNCGVDVPGCVNQCSGTVSCTSITAGQTICTQMGCSWNLCSGTHNACSTYGSSDCTTHGCTWSATCSGVPSGTCTGKTQSQCIAADPPCYWDGDNCIKTPVRRGTATRRPAKA